MVLPAKVLPIDRPDEQQLRIDLVAALRFAAYFDWYEGVANHFSAADLPDGRKLLADPQWNIFRASLPGADVLMHAVVETAGVVE